MEHDTDVNVPLLFPEIMEIGGAVLEHAAHLPEIGALGGVMGPVSMVTGVQEAREGWESGDVNQTGQGIIDATGGGLTTIGGVNSLVGVGTGGAIGGGEGLLAGAGPAGAVLAALAAGWATGTGIKNESEKVAVEKNYFDGKTMQEHANEIGEGYENLTGSHVVGAMGASGQKLADTAYTLERDNLDRSFGSYGGHTGSEIVGIGAQRAVNIAADLLPDSLPGLGPIGQGGAIDGPTSGQVAGAHASGSQLVHEVLAKAGSDPNLVRTQLTMLAATVPEARTALASLPFGHYAE